MDHRASEPASAPHGHPAAGDASPLDLQQFCGDDEFRLWLHKPFRFGDHSFATNGHIIVRVAARDGDGPPEKASGKLEAILDEIFGRSNSLTFTPPGMVEIPPAETEECSDCEGRGVDHDCPKCQCRCLSCSGAGKSEVRISTNLAGAIFSLRYVRQIAALPGLEVAAGSADASTSTPMLFRFAGGDGALMAMRSKYKLHIEIEAAQSLDNNLTGAAASDPGSCPKP